MSRTMIHICMANSAVAVFLLLMVASCRKSAAVAEIPRSGISFSTSVPSRALVDDTDALKTVCTGDDGQSIAIYSSTLPEPHGGEEPFGNTPLWWSSGDGMWTYGDAKYWVRGYDYSFWAVYPYSETPAYSLSDDKSSLEMTGYAITAGNLRTDLMLGSARRDQTAGVDPSPVPLSLHHALAAVEFRIRNGSGIKITSIDDISFSGMKTKCDISMSAASSDDIDGLLTVNSEDYNVLKDNYFSGSGESFEIPSDGISPDITESYGLSGGAFMAVPQRVTNAGGQVNREVILQFSVLSEGSQTPVTRTVNLSSNTTADTEQWEAGKRYTYTITLTSTDIMFEVTVIDWIDDIISLN